MSQQEVETGTSDIVYDLVSILYHALDGADTYEMYIEDAEEAGDDELTQFFREAQGEEKRRADRAKQLLMQHWETGEMGTEERAA